MPFTEEQARVAGSLVIPTRHLGLSPEDRACLALGIVLKVPIYTADKNWKKLKLGIPIHVIRGSRNRSGLKSPSLPQSC